MDLKKYIFEDGKIRTVDLLEWCIFCECCSKQVAETFFGTARVSTVFLALNHFSSGVGEPVLFETMIFAEDVPKLHHSLWRYSTIDQALRGHFLAAERLGEFFVDLSRKDHPHDCGSHKPDYETRSAAIRAGWKAHPGAQALQELDEWRKQLSDLFDWDGGDKQ